MYLNETAKLYVKQILMLWDELGHAPSFDEYNNDERTGKANALAPYFGSYSGAVDTSKLYRNRRDELEPPPPPEPKPAKKRKTTPKKAKSTTAPPSAHELTKKLAQMESVAPTVKEATKPATLKPEPVVEPAPPAAQKPPEEPKIAETKPESPSAPKPAEKPQKTPRRRLPETAKPLTEVPQALRDLAKLTQPSEPEEQQDDTPKEPEILETETVELTKVPDPKPIKEVLPMNATPTIVNCCPFHIALVSEQQYYRFKSGDNPPIVAVLPHDSGIATTMTTDLNSGSYAYDNGAGTVFDVQIITSYGRPALIKNGTIYDFPKINENTLLLVERKVAEAARDIGRETDDIVFPVEYATYNGTVYCYKLGKL